MPDKDLRDEDAQPKPPRQTRRGLLFGSLARIVQPPLSTPQWKDAIREQDARGKKDKPDE